MSKDSLNVERALDVGGKKYRYYSLQALIDQGYPQIKKLPVSLKILLENQLRNEGGVGVTLQDVKNVIAWLDTHSSKHDVAFHPARVLMQDFTGVPGVVDLASMRDAVAKRGGDASIINPLKPVDLVIDHSVMVDQYASNAAFQFNKDLEMQRNRERYEFLRWGQSAFDNFRVVPPGTGICHQVNLEYLGKAIWSNKNSDGTVDAYPDTLVGTDSHTTMINGLGVLGWGVGGIEAEAVMLGQPISMLIPEVVGVRLIGRLREGVTATDLVLTVTEQLRKLGVVGKFVEYFGEGLDGLMLADRATLGNMSPEYGATCGLFPIDQITLDYMHLSGRDEQTIALVEAYAKAQGLWRDSSNEAEYSQVLELDLSSVETSLAGPKRPQDRVTLAGIKKATADTISAMGQGFDKQVAVKGQNYSLKNGDVIIAAITSCTNTSNPNVMVAAGLLAKKAVEAGLVRKPWVKSSLAPGSKVVTDYLAEAGLMPYLEQLGFNLVGYGCTTCIGNSGPLLDEIEAAIDEGDVIACSVLSGNRNFEGRIHQKSRANWLGSPPLVVAFALAGTTLIDLRDEPIAEVSGRAVYLKDIWPTDKEVQEAVRSVHSTMYKKEYAEVFAGDEVWQSIAVAEGKTYAWQADSTYIHNPPFFEEGNDHQRNDIVSANILALLGDSITTDHISPAGAIAANSPAAKWLQERGVARRDFNSYGSRRGNHHIMMRGTFANIRIRNEMLDNVEGGYTRYIPTGEKMSIFDASMQYQKAGTPLVVIAGKEYGTGSSRDWAAKGTRLLGVYAVVAESYERIHRSNLVGMGILPLQFKAGTSRKTLGLDGSEKITIRNISDLKVADQVTMEIERSNGEKQSCVLDCRIDTSDEINYYYNGGILQYVLENLLKA